MSKYIDLAERVKRERDLGPITGLDGETYALKWLDDHPGQVPGRTITRTGYNDILKDAVKTSGYDDDDWERGFCTGLTVGGVKIVPDPEPTNAEKLESFVEAWNSGQRGFTDLGSFLDFHGVKVGGES